MASQQLTRFSALSKDAAARPVSLRQFKDEKLRLLGLLDVPVKARTGGAMDNLLDAMLAEFSTAWSFFTQVERDQDLARVRLPFGSKDRELSLAACLSAPPPVHARRAG